MLQAFLRVKHSLLVDIDIKQPNTLVVVHEPVLTSDAFVASKLEEESCLLNAKLLHPFL